MKRYFKRITSLFLSAVMLITITAGIDFSASAAVYGEDIVEYARKYIGCSYQYAGKGPDSFDCSGFVQYVFKHFGISMPGSTSEFNSNPTAYGKIIANNSVEKAQAGDIILWYNSKVRHVAIYTENNHCIEAANSKTGVRESDYTVDSLSKYNGSYRLIRVYGVEPKPEFPPIELGYVDKAKVKTEVTGISADITWAPVDFAQGYEIRFLTDTPGDTWKVIAKTSKPFFTINNLSFGHNYSIQIRAFAKSGNTMYYSPGWSNSIGFSALKAGVAGSRIGSVKNIIFRNVNDTSAVITFNAVKGANAYQVEYSTDNQNWEIIEPQADNFQQINGLSPLTGYYFKVKAYAKCGSETAYSNSYSQVFKLYTTPAAGNAELRFTDLKGYESYNGYLTYTSVNNSFIMGTNPPENTLYSPNSLITRGMFVTILYRMAGSPYDESNPYEETPFEDITDTQAYYYNAACWALDKGITTEKNFKPYDNVSREQTAAFLYRYAEMENKIDDGYKAVDLAAYPDRNSVSAWAVEPLRWANYENMITGTAQGYLNPKNSTLRIHASKILFGFGIVCSIGNFE